MAYTKKRLTIILVTAAVLVVGGGVAFAYWTSTGTGTGAATTGTSTAFVVTSSAPTGGPLTPGGPAQTVAFNVNNPSSGIQNLASVTVTIAEGVVAGVPTPWDDVPGCSAADYTIGTPDFDPGDIPAGGDLAGTVTITMNNLGSNQDACKGATVPLLFVVA